MKGFILSFRSEFYKSRKTAGFWSAVILPLLLCLLIFVGFYNHADKMAMEPGMMLWAQYFRCNGLAFAADAYCFYRLLGK